MKAIEVVKEFWAKEVEKMSEEQLAIEILYFCKGMVVDLTNPRKTLIEAKLIVHSALNEDEIVQIYEDLFAVKSRSDFAVMPGPTS